MSRKYRPSNGTEGDWFTEKFCINCKHENYLKTGRDNARQCRILTNSLMYDLTDKEYPKEWIYDDNDNPICIQFDNTKQKRKSGRRIKIPNLFEEAQP